MKRTWKEMKAADKNKNFPEAMRSIKFFTALQANYLIKYIAVSSQPYWH